MAKIDLITGFLGSGKTTFLKQYARYWLKQGQRIAIVENDLGAVNVDALLLQDLVADGCELEMVVGGGDPDCLARRFRTKLIALGMQGFDRVIVEPSGIYDVDGFFDPLREEPLDRWYTVGNVITVVDALLPPSLSPQGLQYLAGQAAVAGRLVFSRTQLAAPGQTEAALRQVNNALKLADCPRQFTLAQTVTTPWDALTPVDWQVIAGCGCQSPRYTKRRFGAEKTFSTLYFFNLSLTRQALCNGVTEIFADPACAGVSRIKGFWQDEAGRWFELNATRHGLSFSPADMGQNVLIAVGEGIREEPIRAHWQQCALVP